jgi:hypothetical protein
LWEDWTRDELPERVGMATRAVRAFSDLLRDLYQSVADHSEEKVLGQYSSYDRFKSTGSSTPSRSRPGAFA